MTVDPQHMYSNEAERANMYPDFKLKNPFTKRFQRCKGQCIVFVCGGFVVGIVLSW